MADLFEQVLHHLEGEENEIQNWKSETGERAYSVPSFGPDRWIERAALGRFMAIDVLAVILFCVRDTFDIEKESRIVDGWAAELRKAASDGEIQARDPLTLLALGTLLTDWEWLISISDADKFVVARGMSWKCSEQVEYLLEQARQSGTRYLDPKSGRLLKRYWLAGYEPQPAPAHSTTAPQHHSTTAPAPVVQATETKEQRQDRRLDACEKCGLVMPKSYLSRLPDGVGHVADLEEVTRQAFSMDVKAALERRESATREGRTVHRA